QKPDGIFISQDKYVAEILKKFDSANVKTASTPIETQKPLVKDEEANDSYNDTKMRNVTVSDDTAKTVVVMFDETATSLLKCSAASMVTSQTQVYFCSLYNLSNTHIDLRLPDEEEHSGLPITLANIVGTSHTLELKSHTYYKHGNYKSFTCWRVVTDDAVEESSNSGMVAAKADSKAPMVKRLNKGPSVTTPSKLSETKKHGRSANTY
ncbi:hypothetical protein Tco_1159754, partial [Tanacetum coccineum]